MCLAGCGVVWLPDMQDCLFRRVTGDVPEGFELRMQRWTSKILCFCGYVPFAWPLGSGGMFSGNGCFDALGTPVGSRADL